MKIIKNFIKTTTTKKLTWLVAFTWFFTVVMSFVSTIFWGVEVAYILTAVSGTFAIVLPSYLIKSYSENKSKYANVANDISEKVEEVVDNFIV